MEGQSEKQIDQKLHDTAIYLNNDLVYAPTSNSATGLGILELEHGMNGHR